MKLITASKLLISAIVILILISISIGIWGWNELDKPYQINKEYQQRKSLFDVDIRILLERYLASGNADLLQQAETKLAQLIDSDIAWLNEKDNGAIRATVKAVQDNVQSIRAAGKLAADPQALLINNERERAGDINILLNYADKASESFQATRVQFLFTLTQLTQTLNNVARLRQQYFASKNPKIKMALLDSNARILTLSKSLLALPRFGIYTEVDEDALIAEEPEEIGQLSINSLISLSNRYDKELENTLNLDQRMREARSTLNQSLESLSQLLTEFSTRIDSIKNDITGKVEVMLVISIGLVIAAITILFLLQNKMIAFLIYLESFLRKMLNGDYQQPLNSNFNYQEILSVERSGLQLQTYLASLIDKLTLESEQVISACNEMQRVSTSAVDLTHQQNEATNHVATAVTQLSYSFKDVAQNASSASESANSANDATTSAKQQLSITANATQDLANNLLAVEEVMNRLEEGGKNIGAVLEVIQGVAEQTNLLALNAAIEAARAGEYGRGFSVVADEVRKLASRTTQSTEEIRSIIQEVISTSAEAADTVKQQSKAASNCAEQAYQTEVAIEPVMMAVNTIKNLNTAIAAATQEQTATVDEIAHNTEDIKVNADAVNATISEIKHAGDSLLNVSETLNELIRQLKHQN